MSRLRFYRPFIILVVAAGVASLVFSLQRLPLQQLDWRFLLLILATAALSSRLSVAIPHVKGEVTIGDTLIFLTMMLYGGEAAVLVATVDGLCSSLHVSKKTRVFFFNSAQMACSTFLTVWTMRFAFGSIRDLARGGFTNRFFAAICVMALIQYVTNSGLVAIYSAFYADRPIFTTWRRSYLWTSITYFAGASIAALTVNVLKDLSIYAVLMIMPIVAIIYFTYKTYLRTVQISAQKAEEAKLHADELARYIEEQDRIRAQFGQIEKMSALGELASGVAHDFNNTLAAIQGRAELMLRKANDPDTRRGLEIIVKAANDGAGTVKRIQDFARQRRDHDFEPVAVDQLLMDVNEITRPRWKDRAQANNVHIHLNLQINTPASILGDPSELREVLVNMVFNAVDAMPDGGRLTLSAEEVDDSIEIAVSDTGVGMGPEIRSRIFDPFFTTKGQAGMGLGLAVCYGIIQRHDGAVEIESEIGQGTTFRIRLPIADATPAIEVKKESPTRLTLVRNSTAPKILVVDDEACVRDLLVEILETEGYEVTVAENGEQALDLFDSKNFKAVFTDVGMPGMSGWELARLIRQRNEDIPLAVITGWGEAVSSSEKESAKIDWVVTKPFAIDRVCEIALEIAERANLRSSRPVVATGT